MSSEQPPGGQPEYAPPAGGAPAGYGAAPQPQKSSKAVASLVLGIVGIFICPLICSTLAVVFGYQARKEAGESGLATAGIVLGWIGIALGVLIAGLFVAGALSA